MLMMKENNTKFGGETKNPKIEKSMRIVEKNCIMKDNTSKIKLER